MSAPAAQANAALAPPPAAAAPAAHTSGVAPPASASSAAASSASASSAAAVARSAFLSCLSGRSLVVDLGGSTLKVGWAGQTRPTRLLPNCAVKHKRDTKWMVGDQITGGGGEGDLLASVAGSVGPSSGVGASSSGGVAKIMDYSGLYVRRPMERGFVVNWELEHQVFARAFHRSVLDPYQALTPSAAQTLVEDSSLLITLPPCCPPALAKDLDEAMLEKWAVKRYRRLAGAALAHRGALEEQYPTTTAAPPAHTSSLQSPVVAPASATGATAGKEALHRLCSLVVDSGYSFTHVMPVYQGSIIKSAVKRSVELVFVGVRACERAMPGGIFRSPLS